MKSGTSPLLRPTLFIGSAKEHIELSRAVHTNLRTDVEATVWDQGVFGMSDYPVDALLASMQRSDFGVFILAASDIARIRGSAVSVPRDNVVFELGMFTGHLGRKRVFVVVPDSTPAVSLPSDLAGLTVGVYDSSRRDGNLVSALAPVCSEIRAAIRERHREVAHANPGLVSAHLFPDFNGWFGATLPTAREMTFSFIHSRRFRENHSDSIRAALENGAHLRAMLPDLADRKLIAWISQHFDDEPVVPSLIQDAYRYFAELSKDFPRRVKIWLVKQYPVYSFYIVDDRAVLALYPNSRVKRSVPTFEIDMKSLFGTFLLNDLQHLLKSDARRVTRTGLLSLLR